MGKNKYYLMNQKAKLHDLLLLILETLTIWSYADMSCYLQMKTQYLKVNILPNDNNYLIQ